MKLGDITKQLRTANGWGTPEVARRASAFGRKVSYQNIQHLEEKPNTSPGYLSELAAAFGKSIDDLLSWRPGMPTLGPNDPSGVVTRAPVATSEIRPGYVRIARLAVEAAAGTGAVVDDETEVVEMLEVAEWWAQQHLPRDTSQVRVITARGDSMAPDIQHGDVLFVDISKPRFEAPGLYVMNWAGRAMVKRLSPEFASNRLALLSKNPEYPPEYVDVSEVDRLHIAGRVAAWWTLRKF